MLSQVLTHLVDGREVLLKGHGQPVDGRALAQLPCGVAQQGSIRVQNAGSENAAARCSLWYRELVAPCCGAQLVTQTFIYLM